MRNRPVWTTKDKQRIPVRRLGDLHLLNIIAMLERNESTARLKAVLQGELVLSTLQGEAAQDCVERGLAYLADSDDPADIWPIYHDLVDEATRRWGLEWPSLTTLNQCPNVHPMLRGRCVICRKPGQLLRALSGKQKRQ